MAVVHTKCQMLRILISLEAPESFWSSCPSLASSVRTPSSRKLLRNSPNSSPTQSSSMVLLSIHSVLSGPERKERSPLMNMSDSSSRLPTQRSPTSTCSTIPPMFLSPSSQSYTSRPLTMRDRALCKKHKTSIFTHARFLSKRNVVSFCLTTWDSSRVLSTVRTCL